MRNANAPSRIAARRARDPALHEMEFRPVIPLAGSAALRTT
jgi:hypothetical protein